MMLPSSAMIGLLSAWVSLGGAPSTTAIVRQCALFEAQTQHLAEISARVIGTNGHPRVVHLYFVPI
ncbi:MAG: hypothetical protein ACKOVA_15615 [Novosphingobium sp.]